MWVRVILDKYLYSRPSHRLLQELAGQGVRLSPGTIAGGLRKLLPLLEPVREAIRSKQLSEDRWQADETGWRVFEEVEGKEGHGWHLWVFRSPSTVVFTLSPSRSAQVPEAHFGDHAAGILLSDRYAVYKKLARQWEDLELAFCWAHVRRDFFCLAKAWPEQEGWAMSWVEGIGGLFDLNRRRLQVREQPESFAARDRDLRGVVRELERRRDAELESSAVHEACKKVLRSLQRHWEGLTVFVEHPEVAMDNNASERALRGPVMGRKNYYGSGSRWNARLAAVLFTILQTLQLWEINPQRWLSSYLECCAESGNRAAPDLKRFLPWEMDPAQRAAWSRPVCREAA